MGKESASVDKNDTEISFPDSCGYQQLWQEMVRSRKARVIWIINQKVLNLLTNVFRKLSRLMNEPYRVITAPSGQN